MNDSKSELNPDPNGPLAGVLIVYTAGASRERAHRLEQYADVMVELVDGTAFIKKDRNGGLAQGTPALRALAVCVPVLFGGQGLCVGGNELAKALADEALELLERPGTLTADAIALMAERQDQEALAAIQGTIVAVANGIVAMQSPDVVRAAVGELLPQAVKAVVAAATRRGLL